MNRRRFLQCAAGSLALPAARAWPQPAPGPNDRIALGCIGVGPRANALLGGFLRHREAVVVAVCDVNDKRCESTSARINKAYGNQDCRTYRDYRELLARADIDAVIIATPDHWHALQVIGAARAGKHVYSEKPFCRTVREGRAMVDAVRRHGIVFQHGTQQRSDGRFRLACELVRNGRLGRVHTVRVAAPGGRQGEAGVIGQPPPGFDYEMWLGPAPWAPYSSQRVTNNHWWFIEDYSAGGFISGWGVHHVDIAQWALGVEHTGPEEIEGTAVFPTSGMCDTPITWHVEYHFGGETRVIFTTPNEAPAGVTFEGDEGQVFVTRGRMTVEPESLAEPLTANDIHLYESHSHSGNWLDCIRTGAETVAPVETAHRTQTVCCLSDIAVRLGRRLRWDADRERFIDDAQADRLLDRAMREPWRWWA